MKKADGTVVPVQGALVEIFRTDIKSSGPADKTDKKGVFNFAGLPLGATYVISVSAPGAAPQYLPN
ncbi:carboxypeptidase-like regulatory domain-containing protein, partial [Escherichia coli]|nr:carboxypeptidase-like regulatory domain-containing protein [Escherichia coli]